MPKICLALGSKTHTGTQNTAGVQPHDAPTPFPDPPRAKGQAVWLLRKGRHN